MLRLTLERFQIYIFYPVKELFFRKFLLGMDVEFYQFYQILFCICQGKICVWVGVSVL